MIKTGFLKKIIETLESGYNIEDTLHVMCKELQSIFEVDAVAIFRCENLYSECKITGIYFAESFVPEVQKIVLPEKYKKYLKEYVIDMGQDIIINNLQKADVPNFYKEFHNQLGTKSIMTTPIKKRRENWGVLALFTNRNYREWADEDVYMLHTFADYIYMVITHAELYNSLKQSIASQKAILNNIPFMAWLKDKDSRLLAVNDQFARMCGDSVENIIGKTDFDFFPNEYAELYVENDREIIKEKKARRVEEIIFGPDGDRIHETYKSPVFDDKGEVIGTVGLSRDITNEKKAEQELLRKQEKIVRSNRLLSLLRDINGAIHSTLDINSLKRIIVNKASKIFDADLTNIYLIDVEANKFQPIDEYSFYVSSPKIKSPLGLDIEEQGIGELLRRTPSELVYSDANKFIEDYDLKDAPMEKILLDLKIKSFVSVPIVYRDKYLGILAIDYIKNPRTIVDEDVQLIKTIANQAGIALYQAILFEDQKKRAERERLIREIISTIRSSLDINDVKNKIVNTIGKTLGVERCFINEFSDVTGDFEGVNEDSEYKSAPEIKSYVGFEFTKGVPGSSIIPDIVKSGEMLIINDIDDYLKNYPEDHFLVKMNKKLVPVKSSLGIPIKYGDQILGALVLQYQTKKVKFDDEFINLTATLADQSAIAIYQARLYEKETNTAIREKLLRDIISTIRNTLDINEVFKTICSETGELFNVGMAAIIEFTNKGNYNNWEVKGAYLKFPKAKGLGKSPNEILANEYNFRKIFEDGYIAINNIPESDCPDFYKEVYRNLGIKSLIGVPIQTNNTKWGMLFLSEYKEFRYWTEDEIILLKAIADQVYLAIRQAELFMVTTQNAQKEKILREITTDLKISENPEDVFKYILPKMSGIFNVNRILFIEAPQTGYEKPLIKHEYLDIDCPSLKGKEVLESAIDFLFTMPIDSKPIVINNTDDIQNSIKDIQDFLKKYCINSIIIQPLIRYNHDIKLIGSFVLISDVEHSWSEYEKDLLENIAAIITRVIWDIKRRKELEDLRNAFILTLAHDIQMPLVGERTALEFLRGKHDSIEKYYSILDELIHNNRITYELLSRLIHSYNYESGILKLNKASININILIDEVIRSKEEFAKSKSVTIDFNPVENIPHVCVDSYEIKTALDSLIDNAIKYSYENGTVVINVEQQNSSIIVCISDTGEGITTEARSRIFQRYAMAQLIERKFGSGLGLYLVKQIIEAHNGKIWYTTELGKGTRFCFSLPISS